MNDLTRTEDPGQRALAPMTVGDMLGHVAVVRQIASGVMKADVHYGVIPGTDRASLLQPGAQMLCLAFHLSPSYDVRITDLGGGHREYDVTCTLTHQATGIMMAEGVGSCSTMESRYRYRSENTGEEVPREYWDTRDSALLGGPGFSTRKVKGRWFIFHRVEHQDPADYWNTCKKMGSKRALVAATLACTAAGDVFQEDLDEDTGAYGQAQPGGSPEPEAPREPTVRQPARKSGGKSKPAKPRGDGTISEGAERMLYAKMRDKGIEVDIFKAKYGVEHVKDLPQDAMNGALEWIASYEPEGQTEVSGQSQDDWLAEHDAASEGDK